MAEMPADRAPSGPQTPQVEILRRLAKEATNGWACYAKTNREHDEIARLHREIDLTIDDAQPANPSSAPSGPDVARQIAEQAREHWIEVGKLRERALMTRSPKTCDGLLEMAKREDNRAGSLLARALADARREALEEAATEADLQASVFGAYTTVPTVADWLRQRAAQEAPK